MTTKKIAARQLVSRTIIDLAKIDVVAAVKQHMVTQMEFFATQEGASFDPKDVTFTETYWNTTYHRTGETVGDIPVDKDDPEWNTLELLAEAEVEVEE